MATVHPGHADPQRTLVAFYSRDGHTRQIALEIAAACHADLEQIVEAGSPLESRGDLRSALQALLGVAVPLNPTRHPPQGYGLVVIGTPVWAWNMSGPVRAWVHEHRSHMHRVAFFCTYGGSGSRKVLADLAQLSGKAPLATLAITRAQCALPEHAARVQAFAEGLIALSAPRGAQGAAGSGRAAPA